MDLIWIPVAAGVIGIAFVVLLARYVLGFSQGTKRMREISAAIQEGAFAFLNREYRILAGFVAVVAVVLWIVPDLGAQMALTFVFGACCSMGSGLLGMNMAVRSNARTASAARRSLGEGLKVSFSGGSVMGLCVVSVGILGLSLLYLVFGGDPSNFIRVIPAYGFGASSVALFARVGGGIYTKGADAAADLVGKVEKGIPEDDPRNAAVIADFVGDNVGDVAGMGADLFESYVGSIIATMTLYTVAVGRGLVVHIETAWLLPMMVAAGGIVASIIGIFSVRIGKGKGVRALLRALRKGTFTAIGLITIFAFLIVHLLRADLRLFWAIMSGLVAGVLIGESTNYFTSYTYAPTRRISEASQTGAGTTVVRGLANGLFSTLPPILFVALAILVAHHFASVYGIALAGVGMLSTLGISLASDAYGPVADNSGGIAEMAGMPRVTRRRTDALDSLGNTTAATGKGFAIGSAALTSLALLLAYAHVIKEAGGVDLAGVSFLDAHVMAGFFIGLILPAVFCSLTLNAVSVNAFMIVNEVRRQFREIPGLMEGKAKPEYGKCVDISTKGALRKMVFPTLIAIAAPLLVGFVLGPAALGGFLVGAIGCGFLLAITMANAGGSMDNAKKWIEAGAYGGKGSEAHKAGVIGDLVGDPMKDTSGPSLNIMIKLMSIISLILAPLLARFGGLLV